MEKKYKTTFAILTVAIVSISLLAFPAFSKNQNSNAKQKWGPTLEHQNIKNVIVMVPDGCSYSIQTAARWYNGGSLNLDQIVTGTVATWMADSIITDSASAATAFATGYKTTDGFISVGPVTGLDTPLDETDDFLTGFDSTADPYAPLATVLEGAKLEGKSTGLVATSRITHATPAAYAAHINDRNMENEIMEQLVYQDIDVVLGGGKRHLLPTSDGGKRTDGENLVDVLLERGYDFVETKSDLNEVTSTKVWGMFASSHMEADIDRATFAPEQPSLAEMTQKAIELLSQDKNGFFLMVEGSQVDWAGHANDPAHMITDFLAFDEAVGVALDFAESDGKTLVISFPDHNTGGLSIGSYYQDTNVIAHGYTDLTIEDLIDPIQGMEITSTGLGYVLDGDTSDAKIIEVIDDWWNLEITPADVAKIKSLAVEKQLSLTYAISEYVCEKFTSFGWTTHGHTGEDVPLWAYGPKDALPAGHYDNTELAFIVAEALGFDLGDINAELFVNLDETSFDWELNLLDSENPVVDINIDGDTYHLPTSKDLLTLGSSEMELTGVIVYVPKSGHVYIPQQVIDIIS